MFITINGKPFTLTGFYHHGREVRGSVQRTTRHSSAAVNLKKKTCKRQGLNEVFVTAGPFSLGCGKVAMSKRWSRDRPTKQTNGKFSPNLANPLAFDASVPAAANTTEIRPGLRLDFQSFHSGAHPASGAASAGFCESVERHGQNDNHSNDDLLDVRRHVQDHEPVQQHPDQQRSDHRAKDRADPAK